MYCCVHFELHIVLCIHYKTKLKQLCNKTLSHHKCYVTISCHMTIYSCHMTAYPYHMSAHSCHVAVLSYYMIVCLCYVTVYS